MKSLIINSIKAILTRELPFFIRRKRTITFSKIIIRQNEMKKMTPSRMRQYLMVTNILHELSVIHKLLLFSHQGIDEKIEISQPAGVALSMYFLKTLASINFEAINFFRSNINRKDNYPQELQDSCARISQHLKDGKNEKILRSIRNKFGFHYDSESDAEKDISEVLLQYESTEAWLVNEQSGNDIFESTTTATIQVIVNQMTKIGFEGDEEVLFHELVELILETSNLMKNCFTKYLTHVILGGIQLEEKYKLKVNVPDFTSIKLPIIVNKKY